MRYRPLLLALVVAIFIAGCTGDTDKPQSAPNSPTSVQQSFARIQLSDVFFAEGASVGDFNLDSVMDIVAGPYWYVGPSFQQSFAYYQPVPFDPMGTSDNFLTFVGDFNLDRFPDILVVNFPGLGASWYENPRNTNLLWVRHEAIAAVNGESPTLADLTGDGVPELVCISAGQQLGWAEPNPGDPTKPWVFHAVSPDLGYGPFTHGLGVGDVSMDGKMDILEPNGWWEQPPTLLGDPIWAFHSASFGAAAQLYAVDFDGDSLNDVVASTPHDYGLAWFQQVRQSGEISFCKHQIMGDPANPNRYGVAFSQLHSMAVADINRDSVPDIVTGKRRWAHGPTGDVDANGLPVLYWFRTVRTLQGVDFVPYLIDSQSGVGTQFFVGDVDGDGRLDIVTSNKLGTFFLKQGTGTAAPPQPQLPLATGCQA